MILVHREGQRSVLGSTASRDISYDTLKVDTRCDGMFDRGFFLSTVLTATLPTRVLTLSGSAARRDGSAAFPLAWNAVEKVVGPV